MIKKIALLSMLFILLSCQTTFASAKARDIRLKHDQHTYLLAGTAGSWDTEILRTQYAHTKSRGANTKIAILDTGVDITHPALQGQIEIGPNFVTPDTPSIDGNGHGTHVAGIAAQTSPESKILIIKVLDDKGYGWLSNVIGGIMYATDSGVDVINLSLSGFADTESLHEALRYARRQGVIVTCAAGNNSKNQLSYPAAYPECSSVVSISRSGELSAFSNYGPGVDFAAPGELIASTLPGGKYGVMQGTSMATPFVSASIALLKAQGWTGDQALSILEKTAMNIGPPDLYGKGLINPYDATSSNLTLTKPFKCDVQQIALRWRSQVVFKPKCSQNVHNTYLSMQSAKRFEMEDSGSFSYMPQDTFVGNEYLILTTAEAVNPVSALIRLQVQQPAGKGKCINYCRYRLSQSIIFPTESGSRTQSVEIQKLEKKKWNKVLVKKLSKGQGKYALRANNLKRGKFRSIFRATMPTQGAVYSLTGEPTYFEIY